MVDAVIFLSEFLNQKNRERPEALLCTSFETGFLISFELENLLSFSDDDTCHLIQPHLHLRYTKPIHYPNQMCYCLGDYCFSYKYLLFPRLYTQTFEMEYKVTL